MYFNLGNAYYRLGNLGKAILNYERARLIMSDDEDLRYNLHLANLMIVDKIEPTPRLFLWEWWDGIKGAFSIRSITWLTYLFYVVLIGAIASFLLARTYALRKTALVGIAAAGFLAAGSFTIFRGKLADATAADTAIVTAIITTIKNSPDTKSSDAFVLHSGVKVRITDRVSNWAKIRLGDGKVGWMDISAAELI